MNKQIKSNTSGQSLIEYIAITALVAVVSITAVKLFGGKVKNRMEMIGTKFDNEVRVAFGSSRKSSHE